MWFLWYFQKHTTVSSSLHSDIYVILQTAVGCVRGGEADHLPYCFLWFPQQTLGFLITTSSWRKPIRFGVWLAKKKGYRNGFSAGVYTHTHTLKSNIDTQNDVIFGKIKYVFQPTTFGIDVKWCIFPKSQSSWFPPNTNIAGSPLEIGETNHWFSGCVRG